MLRTGFIGVLSATAALAAFSCSSSESSTVPSNTGAGGSGGSGGITTGGSGGSSGTGGSKCPATPITDGTPCGPTDPQGCFWGNIQCLCFTDHYGCATIGTGGAGGVATGGSGGTGGLVAGGSGGAGGVVAGGAGGVATGGSSGTGGVVVTGGAGGVATGGSGGAPSDAGPNGTASDGSTKPGAIDGGATRIFPPTVPVGAPTPIGAQTNPRTITFENHCTYAIWMFGSPVADKTLVPVKIDSGQALVTTWPDLSGGRLWGRTNCVKNGTNWACDQTGNDTLVEFTLTRGEQSDWYNLSMVDGYTLPVALLQMSAPFTIPATYTTGMRLDTSGVQQCGSPVCAAELLANCPADHRITNNGKTVGCKNGESTNGGAGATPLTLYLKNGCPTTYTFPYDDPWSLFKCKTLSQGLGKAKDYKVVWCPTEGPVPGFPQYPLQ